LEGSVQRQLGVTDCDKEISHPSDLQTHTTRAPPQPSLTSWRPHSPGRGDKVSPTKASNSTDLHLISGILFQHVSGTQERRGSKTRYQPETLEHIHEIRVFQDGGPAYSQSSSPEERLDGKNRFKGCLLHGTDSTSIPSPFPLQSREQNLSVQLPTVWSIHGPRSVYKNLQASGGIAEVNGVLSSDIHRRYAPYGHFKQIAYRSLSLSIVPVRQHRIYNQQQKISFGTNPGNRVSWDDHQFPGDVHKTPWYEDQRYHTGDARPSQSSQSFSTLSITADRQTECNHFSSSDGSSLLPVSPDLFKTITGSQFTELPVTCSVICLGSRGPPVMATSSVQLEWEKPNLPTVLNDNNFRCLSPGLGSPLQWSTDQRSVVSSRTSSPHQLLRASCSLTSCEDICKGEIRNYNSPEVRQHHSCRLYQQNGGTASPMLSQLTKDLWLRCMGRNILLQAQHLPGVLNSIANEESRIWSDRSEWKLSPILFQKINHLLGPLTTDLFASRLSPQLPAFISWKPDPLTITTDAFSVDWSSLPGKL